MSIHVYPGKKVWMVYDPGYGKRRSVITEQVVDKVGRKYFTLVGDRNKFDLEAGQEVSQYAKSYTIYTDIEVYHESLERRRLLDLLRQKFGSGMRTDLTLDQLHRIEGIINEGV